MIGVGILIFGVFVTLFGYVLITCIISERHHCVNRTTATITDIKRLGITELNEAFYRVFVSYFVNKQPYTSSFVIHSSTKYEIGTNIDVFPHPNHPNRILNAKHQLKIPPYFIVLTAVGTLLLVLGIILTIYGI